MSTLAKVGIVLCVIIIIVAICCSVLYMSFMVVKFEGTTVYYVTDNETGYLKGILVQGYLVHDGWKRVDLRDVHFECSAEFLEDNMNEAVTTSLVDDTKRSIDDGEKVKFEADLGQVKEQTRVMKTSFKVVYKDVENDSIIVDVSNYYG